MIRRVEGKQLISVSDVSRMDCIPSTAFGLGDDYTLTDGHCQTGYRVGIIIAMDTLIRDPCVINYAAILAASVSI